MPYSQKASFFVCFSLRCIFLTNIFCLKEKIRLAFIAKAIEPIKIFVHSIISNKNYADT